VNQLVSIGLPAGFAYLGVRAAELSNQKGVVGALLGIAGAGLGIYVAGKLKPAVKSVAKAV
jgi:hypothetical protein